MKDDAMTSEEMIRLCKAHTMYAWAKGDAVDPLPIERAEGVWLYTPDGKKILDFNSQLMCVNIGHGHPKVVQAIAEQAAKLCYVYPGTATAVRARVSQKLAALVPGDINTFFFTLAAPRPTRTPSRRRDSSPGARRSWPLSQLPRRHQRDDACSPATRAAGPTSPACRAWCTCMDPSPYDFSFGTPKKRSSANHLAYLEEVIMWRGRTPSRPCSCETVTGSNGLLPPPEGLPAGAAQAARQVRHPAHLRRGDGGLRAHRQDVRVRALRHRPGHRDHGQGADEQLLPARRDGRARQDRRTLQARTCSGAA
jgi:taurine--2-oxoglutarate transaminase